MKRLSAVLLLSSASLAAAAQSAPAFTTTCEEGRWGSRETPHACETRDLTLPAAKASKLTVDGGRNGGIAVKGYDGPDIRVRAKVQAWAATDAEAKAKLTAVKILTDGNTLRAEGPSEAERSNTGYAVSYEIFVPRQQALALSTHNGGINLQDVQGAVTFEAENGGVSISGGGGDLKGRTRNGGLHIKLTGSKWDGAGLDVATTNGGITWQLPANYSAQFFTSTTHGPIRTDFPSNVQGSISRSEVAVALGQGGAPVKAVTTNGGVTVSRSGK